MEGQGVGSCINLTDRTHEIPAPSLMVTVVFGQPIKSLESQRENSEAKDAEIGGARCAPQHGSPRVARRVVVCGRGRRSAPGPVPFVG